MNISDINKPVWSLPESVHEYTGHGKLFPPEIIALDIVKAEYPDAVLLDIGIGAGRTTAHLEPASARYVGIDYSREMISAAAQLFPRATLQHMDARDLSTFAEQTFDVVWFSYNGIDYVNHDDRLKIFLAIHRVLKPRSLLIFSSHNRDSKIYPAHHIKHLKPSPNPMRMAQRLIQYSQRIYQSLKLSQHEIHNTEYAIINDPAHGFKLLTYYITAQAQITQLKTMGFNTEKLLGINGDVLESDKIYRDGYCIYYVARGLLEISQANR